MIKQTPVLGGQLVPDGRARAGGLPVEDPCRQPLLPPGVPALFVPGPAIAVKQQRIRAG